MDEADVTEELEQIAEEYDRDFDEVRSIYEDKLAHIQNADVIGIDESDFPRHALATVKSNMQSSKRTGGIVSGDAEEVPILALGLILVTQNWGQNNDHVAVGVGVAAPPDTDSENRLPGLTAFIMNESDGMDIGKARRIFQWGNHVRGWFAIEKLEEAFGGRDREYYVAGSTDRSKIEEASFDGSLPTEPDAIRQFVNENYVKEDFTLATMADNISVDDDDLEFGANWLDLRRIEGQVVDSFRRLPEDCDDDQNPFGKYVLTDDTVESYEDLKERRDLRDEDDIDNDRTPGLQCFVPPEAVKWGEDSTVEIYGVLERNEDNGKHTLRGAGVAPVIPFPRGGDEEEGGDHDDAETEAL